MFTFGLPAFGLPPIRLTPIEPTPFGQPPPYDQQNGSSPKFLSARGWTNILELATPNCLGGLGSLAQPNVQFF